MLHGFINIAIKSTQQDPHKLDPYTILQCQLLAINTPFHLAGVTTYQLAKQSALDFEAHIADPGKLRVATDDLLCSIGLYLMTRSSK